MALHPQPRGVFIHIHTHTYTVHSLIHHHQPQPLSHLQERHGVGLLQHVHDLGGETHGVLDGVAHHAAVFTRGDQAVVGLEQPAVDPVEAVGLVA